MSELNRTGKLSIAIILAALVIVTGLLISRPHHARFKLSAEETAELLSQTSISQILAGPGYLESLEKNSYIIIDLRSPFEVKNAPWEDVVPIPLQDLLSETNLKLLSKYNHDQGSIIVFGKDIPQANAAWMILTQMGFRDVKIFSAPSNPVPETELYDYGAIFTEIGIPVGKAETEKPEIIIPVRKQKKSSAEGGC